MFSETFKRLRTPRL